MRSFIKVQLGAIAGSLADFGITYVFTSYFFIWYLVSNIIGNCAGGFVQFSFSRNWIFKHKKSSLMLQLLKFTLFFLGNIMLSSLGTYFFTEFFHLHYLVSKLLSSLLFGLTYNYWMQKYFVFS